MNFFLEVHGIEWVIGGRWRTMKALPTSKALRKLTNKLHSNCYAYLRNSDGSVLVGFFEFEVKFCEKTIYPLSLAIAHTKGGGFFGLYATQRRDCYLAVITNEEGSLYPQAGIVKRDNLKALDHFKEHAVTVEECENKDGLRDICADLRPVPLDIYCVKAVRKTRVLIVALLVLLSVVGAVLYRQHQNSVNATALMEQKKRIAKLPKPVPSVSFPLPNAFVRTCFDALPKTAWVGGWTLASWSCTSEAILLKWQRQGGNSEEIPKGGDITNSGDTLLQRQYLKYPTPTIEESQKRERYSPNSIAEMSAILEALGIDAVTSNVGSGRTFSKYKFSADFDLRGIDWNVVPALRFLEITHITGAADVSSSASYTVSYTFG